MSRKKKTNLFDFGDLRGEGDERYDSIVNELISDPSPTEVKRRIEEADEYAVDLARFQYIEPEMADPIAMIEKAIAADLDASVLVEKEFPVAPNVVSWCRGYDFLGSSTPDPFPRQLEILVHFFKDLCYLCSDVEYCFNVPVDDKVSNVLDRMVLLEHGVCPECQRNRFEMLEDWHLDPNFYKYSNFDETVRLRAAPPHEFVGIWGQRSGKSLFLSTFVWTYIFHRYLSLSNPCRYFNEPSNKILSATMVAPKLERAMEALWNPFRYAYDSSPWFREVKEYFKSEGKRTGVQLYKEGQRFISFTGKRLAVQVSAAHAGTLRGATRFSAICDELAWYNVNESGNPASGAKSGEQVYSSLTNSLTTIRGKAEWRRRELKDFNSIDAYMLSISSPSSVNDPIMHLGYLAPKRFRMLFSHLPTWEVNPMQYREALEEEYAGREGEFKRDFEAIPPSAAYPFFDDSEFKILSSVTFKERPLSLFDYTITAGEDPMGGRQLLQPVLKNIRPDRSTPRILTIDNGAKKNSFAICVARFMPDRNGILFEEIIEIAPHKGHIVDLAWCYKNLVVRLVENYYFLNVAYDRWESTFAINDLRTNLKVDAQQYSLKWKDFEEFRNDVRSARVWFPEPEIDPSEVLQIRDSVVRARYPRSHLQVQMATVNQFGRKVLKPDGGNDDLFRTAVLAHYFIRKNNKEFQQKSKFLLRNSMLPQFQPRFISRNSVRSSLGRSSYSGSARRGLGRIPGLGRGGRGTGREDGRR